MLAGEKIENPLLMQLVPFIPDGALAGGVVCYNQDGVDMSKCDMVASPIAGCECAIRVTGDSMEPLFPNGSTLFIKQIDSSYIAWHNPFVIATTNGFFVKRIDEVKGDASKILAVSENPKYPPFEIPTDAIYGIYRIILQSKSYSAQ